MPFFCKFLQQGSRSLAKIKHIADIAENRSAIKYFDDPVEKSASVIVFLQVYKRSAKEIGLPSSAQSSIQKPTGKSHSYSDITIAPLPSSLNSRDRKLHPSAPITNSKKYKKRLRWNQLFCVCVQKRREKGNIIYFLC